MSRATGLSYRTTGADLNALTAWQRTHQAQAVSQQLMLSFAFIGVGATGGYVPDTLTPVAQANAGQFRWINHTYHHLMLNGLDYTTAYSEINTNTAISQQYGLRPYRSANLVTPAITGLTTPSVLQAAYDAGVRQLVTDAMAPGHGNPTPNAGLILSGGFGQSTYSLLGVPRHPNNLYYNVSAPDQWLAEDNCAYPPGQFAYAATYNDVLNRESKMLVSYLLAGDIDPLEFHALNVRAYDGVHSLVGDLLDRTLLTYSQLVTVPVVSLPMDGLASRINDRMQYDALRPSVTGSLVTTLSGTSLQLMFGRPGTVPVSGVNGPGAELYAGVPISRVTSAAPGTITLNLSAVTPPSPTVTLTPVQDTYVSWSAPTSTNGGTSTSLRSDLVGYDTALMRFDLSPVASKVVTGAVLSVHTSSFAWSGSAVTHRVSLVSDNSWTEASTSFSAMPAISTSILGTFIGPAPSTWYDIPLDVSVVQAQRGGPLSLAMEGLGSDVFIFDSRESGAATAPRLVLTTQ